MREWERRQRPPLPRAQKFLPYWPGYGGRQKERVLSSFVLIIDQVDQTGPRAGLVHTSSHAMGVAASTAVGVRSRSQCSAADQLCVLQQ